MKKRRAAHNPAAISGMKFEEERSPKLKMHRTAASPGLPEVDLVDSSP